MYILLFLGWALGNMDRYVVNYAVVFIGKDLVLTNTQTGLVLSAFFLGYAIMQIPGGLLADKYGAKKIILISILHRLSITHYHRYYIFGTATANYDNECSRCFYKWNSCRDREYKWTISRICYTDGNWFLC
ncbi:MAG: MFS transporter [Kurthia sp.]|nr:MFS transporter [Candidatus Kurthia equi]